MRCAEKIAAKRCKRAYNKVDEAKMMVEMAVTHLEKMLAYEHNAEDNYNAVAYELAAVLSMKQCHCNGDKCECECH